jgi:hypothetical protein
VNFDFCAFCAFLRPYQGYTVNKMPNGYIADLKKGRINSNNSISQSTQQTTHNPPQT